MSDSPADHEPRADETQPTLLLVDDEPSVLSALRRLFRPHGYRLLQATGGQEGLALLQANTVDLVISDMRMPGMDGSQFLKAVKEHDASVIRILLTGYADIDSTIAAINQGELHRYISKPWEDRDILLTVREALSRRELERRNALLTAVTQEQNERLAQLNLALEARVRDRTLELEQVNAMLTASYTDLDKTFKLSISMFSSLMEMRQDGFAGHSRRVANLARRTAAEMKLSSRDTEDVYLAALLHDIGSIGFPDKMLGKPVSLFSPEEQLRYRRHPLDAEAALMPMAQLQGVARLVRQHHERVDGKGFPDGLTGTEILPGALIVATVSDYDDLVNGCLSEFPHTPEMARQALRGGIASHYDRQVVEALLRVLDHLQEESIPERNIESRELLPGMVLARDLLSAKGVLLLAAGYTFESRVIRQVVEFATREGIRLMLSVRTDDPDQPPAPVPARSAA